MLLAKGVDIRIFYGVATRILFNRMHFVVYGDICNQPFHCQGVPHRRVKSSGVRQSKIYKCPEGTYGSESVKLEIIARYIWLKRQGVIFEGIGDLFLESTDTP